jgi:hypothetical protein
MNPRGPTPSLYEERELMAPARSLVEGLAEVVDDIREIASDLGARPYTYHSVTVQWSGGEVGRGEPTVVRDVPITPTPETREGGIDSPLEAGGIVERGDIVLTGVSPRLTEDEIHELFGDGPQDAGCETFVEQRIDGRDGETKRRRFVLARVPERRPTRCDWRLSLRKADGNRARSGVADGAGRREVWRP